MTTAGGSPTRKLNWADFDSDDDDFGNPQEMFCGLPEIEEHRGQDAKEKMREEEAQRAVEEAAKKKKLKGATIPLSPAPMLTPMTPLQTPPLCVTRRSVRIEAQQQLVAALTRNGSMDAQELSKALEWKRTFYRTVGSLYAFVKRDCKELLTYDSKGRVRMATCPPVTPQPPLQEQQPAFTFPDTPLQSQSSRETEINDIAKSLLAMQW
eukprot:TRINITY_DN34072_c0_g1_i1.p1 TRINITY_DN34072_c0_g1~~TRINITY_DN34072_c0_g1_i1.p1  ORF type:complete len:209 (+),score=56.29 TRINITY_DN34072_c0_g1_i1:56-682(+)